MLNEKIAIVSGGTRGIGRAIVIELAKNGANIAFNYLSEREQADALCQEVRELGSKCIAYQVNITDYKGVKDMVASVEEKLGPVDIVINNAGIIADGALATMPVENWHNVINTNLNGTFNLTRSAITSLMKRRTGIIINIASIAGVYGNPRQTNYSAAKAGMIGFTKALAKEVAGYGVRVNAIAPGFIATDMTKGMVGDTKKIPAKRVGAPEEVAKLVTFLCSSSSDYIIGEVIKIDGGLVI
jgi:3-oxoacyl-[acyl-carrier protein] reductase